MTTEVREERVSAMVSLLESYVTRNLARDRAIKRVKGMWDHLPPAVKDALDTLVGAEYGVDALMAVADALEKNAHWRSPGDGESDEG
jgi:hypothetical protein